MQRLICQEDSHTVYVFALLTKWWSQFLDQLYQILRVAFHDLHELHQDLNSREHNSSIGVREPRGNPLADVLGLLLVLRLVCGQGVQDEDLSPFRALIQSSQELIDSGRVQISQSSSYKETQCNLWSFISYTGYSIMDLRDSVLALATDRDRWISMCDN